MKKVKKVGVMGAHGCGKTTMAGMIFDDLFIEGLLPLAVDEGVRSLKNIPRNHGMTIEGQRAFFQKQIEDEAAAEEKARKTKADIIICDRTVLDPLVYATWAVESPRCTSGVLTQDWAAFVDARIPVMLQMFGQYDFVFWCRPSEDVNIRLAMLKDDGFRDTNPGFQADIDWLFEQFVTKYSLPVIPAEDYSVEMIVRSFEEVACG